MTMPAKEAAKVLRRHNEWRRATHGEMPMPYEPEVVGQALDAAVAALEAVAGAKPVVECYSLMSHAWRECERPDTCTNKKRKIYLGPQPAACAKCKEKTSTSTNKDHEDDAA